MVRNKIYLDNQASTPLDKRVLEAMLPYFGFFCEKFNKIAPIRRTINDAMEEQREKIADLFRL